MGTANFQRGATVRIEGVLYRLLQQVSNFWQLKNLETDLIVQRGYEELQRLHVERKLVFLNGEKAKSSSPVFNTSPEQMELAKLRLHYVRAVLDIPNTAPAMEPVIVDAWNEVKQEPKSRPGWVTVYRWKKRYLEAGSDIRALVDNSFRKGNRKDRFPKLVTEICNDAIEDKFLSPERGTIQDAYNEALLRIHDENQLRPLATALPIPGLRFIRRLINQIPAVEKDSARYGRDAALRTFRSVNGHRVIEAPLERAEIDHTILDLFVVDERTSLPLGRPWVTACIDVYSRCILGIYIGFVPPSCLSVSKCLRDAFLPKVELHEKFPEIKNDWPAHGVMRQLVLDNGVEFHSEALENTCQSLGIEMHFSPRRTPWFKGTIERWFGTLNHDLAQKIPGATFSNIFERGDYDPAKDALVTLSTANTIIRKWICDVYHQRRHRALQISPDESWKTSISPSNIRVPEDVAELELILGRPYSRTLSHKGIELKSLLYKSSELQDLRQQHGATLGVEIRVDEGDIGHIYVIAPDSRRYFRVPALHFDYANGLSSWQHDVFCNKAREWGHENSSIGWLEAKREIVQLIEQDLSSQRKTSHKKHGRFLNDSDKAAKSKNSSQSPAASTAGGMSEPDPLQTPVTETYGDNSSNVSSPILPRQFNRVYQERQRNG
ncbi:MAG: Mu transposase C-terminal domain-containing protein [Terriglobales bacterium]